jgi:hypothetical protein
MGNAQSTLQNQDFSSFNRILDSQNFLPRAFEAILKRLFGCVNNENYTEEWKTYVTSFAKEAFDFHNNLMCLLQLVKTNRSRALKKNPIFKKVMESCRSNHVFQKESCCFVHFSSPFSWSPEQVNVFVENLHQTVTLMLKELFISQDSTDLVDLNGFKSELNFQGWFNYASWFDDKSHMSNSLTPDIFRHFNTMLMHTVNVLAFRHHSVGEENILDLPEWICKIMSDASTEILRSLVSKMKKPTRYLTMSRQYAWLP